MDIKRIFIIVFIISIFSFVSFLVYAQTSYNFKWDGVTLFTPDVELNKNCNDRVFNYLGLDKNRLPANSLEQANRSAFQFKEYCIDEIIEPTVIPRTPLTLRNETIEVG